MKYQLLGDQVLVITYEAEDRKEFPNIVGTHYDYLRRKLTRGINDIVLCHSSIGVYFDNSAVSPSEVKACVITALNQVESLEEPEGKEIVIPVFYGGDFGPDLERAAHTLNMTAEEVISLHSSNKYTVFGIGFLPGFPYMGPLPQKLVIPRKPVPAPFVAAGSVAIAGEKTGIYSFDSPGGWHVIGWTPVKMFDVSASTPCYLKPGDKVSFARR